MFRQLQLATLLTCVSITSYAYTIDANLTVENKTDVALEMIVDQPNHQEQKIIKLPAHTTIHEHMENGDTYTGWLFQYANAPFTIKANDKIYAHGQIVYYLGGAVWRKFTFLDSITTAEGIKIDPTYTCKNGGNTTLANSFVIEGATDKSLSIKPLPQYPKCQGLKISERDKTHLYHPTCSDGSSGRYFTRLNTYCVNMNNIPLCDNYLDYYNDKTSVEIPYTEVNEALMDDRAGNAICGSW